MTVARRTPVVHPFIRILQIALAVAGSLVPGIAEAGLHEASRYTRRGIVMLWGPSISLVPPEGEAMQLAWIADPRDLAASDDGVLVAAKGLGFYGFTPEAKEYESGYETPPLWKADIGEAAVSTDGPTMMALGSDRSVESRTHLVRALRSPDGEWRIEETDIPQGASVVRLVWSGERWLALLRRAMPGTLPREAARTIGGGSVVRERAEIWASPDGLAWSRCAIPLRAERIPEGTSDGDLHLCAGSERHLAFVNGSLLAAGSDLSWREEAPPVGPSVRGIFHVLHADGRFWVEMYGANAAILASSVDGREWTVRQARADSVVRSPPIVVDGTLRWPTADDDDVVVAAPTSLHFDERPGIAPEAPCDAPPYEARRFAAAPSGMLVAGADRVGVVSREGRWERGRWLGDGTRSVASASHGFAVAHRSVEYATWEAPDEVRSELPLHRAVLSADRDDLLALGLEAGTGRSMFARLRPGASWTLVATNLGDDIAPIALAAHAGSMTLLAQREVRCASGADDDRWLRARLEILESADGISWTPATTPLPEIEWGAPFVRAALAVGGGPTAADRRTLVAVENVVFARTGDAAWIEEALPAKPCERDAVAPSILVSPAGGMYWLREPNPPFSSSDGTDWMSWGASSPGRFLSGEWIGGDPLEVGMQWPGRFVRSAVGELFTPPPSTRFARPDAPTRSVLPEAVRTISNPAWDGWQLIAASNAGLLRSSDGVAFTIDAGGPPLPSDPGAATGAPVDFDRRIGRTDDAIWIWPKASRAPRAVDLLVAEGGRGAPFARITPPLVVHEAGFAGRSAVFVGRRVPRGGGDPLTGLSVAWTDDLGRSWNESEIPIYKDALGVVHGSFGWAILGSRAGGDEGVAISTDLRNWRFAPLPRNESVTPIAFGAMRDRFVALVRPDPLLLTPASDALVWSSDGSQWTERMTPAGWFDGTPSEASHALVCAEDRALLRMDGRWLVSRDLERWHLLAGFGGSDPKDHLVGIHDGVAFLSCDAGAPSGRPAAEILAAPLPDDRDLECLPGVLLKPFAPERRPLSEMWVAAFLRWDAMMNSRADGSVSSQARLLESQNLLATWRAVHPGPPTEDGYFWAGAIAYRNMICELGRDNVRASIGILRTMNDPGGVDGVSRSIKAVGSAMNPESAKALEAALADWRGTGPPAFDVADPEPLETTPPVQARPFDTEDAVRRALAGSAGAALDLALAAQLGAGLRVDPAGSDFWLTVAERGGCVSPRLADYRSTEPATVAAIAKAADAGTTFVLMNRVDARSRPDGNAPDPAADRTDLSRAAELGRFEAMVALAEILLLESTDPDEISTGYRWMERAADAGFVPALEWLAQCHECAIGVPRNRRLAAAYTELAAERGSGTAAAALAKRHASGAGVPVDLSAARMWADRAIERGEKVVDFTATFESTPFRPARPRSAMFDVSKRLAQAQAGDAAACFDVAQAYNEGFGVGQDILRSIWWELEAERRGWTEGSPEECAARGSVFAHSWIVDGDRASVSSPLERRSRLEAAAAAGNLHAMVVLGSTLLSGLSDEADRAVGLEWYEKAASAGSSNARVLLALQLGPDGGAAADPRRAYELMKAAGDAGEPSGDCAAALSVLSTPSSDVQRAEALRLLLRAAWIPRPAGLDPARDPESFEVRAIERIAAAALRGEPRAMHAYSILVRASIVPAVDRRDDARRPAADAAEEPFAVTPRIASLAWLQAARLRGEPLPILERLHADEDDEVLAPLEARAIVWRCIMRREPFDGVRSWHEAAANSAPATSLTAKAIRALLDGTLAGPLAAEAGSANEIMAVRGMPTLAESAAGLGELRGLELLAALFGVEPAGGAISIDDLARRVVRAPETEPVAGCLRDDAIRLVAALHYYGIGTERDASKAAALLMHLTQEGADRGARAGFVIDGIDSGMERLAIPLHRVVLGVAWPE
jgi:hypothetical protein